MATTTVSIPTPCGTFTYKIPIPGLPPLPFPPNLNFKFPPDWSIPFPDCSLLKHTGSAPEPPEDSEP